MSADLEYYKANVASNILTFISVMNKWARESYYLQVRTGNVATSSIKTFKMIFIKKIKGR